MTILAWCAVLYLLVLYLLIAIPIVVAGYRHARREQKAEQHLKRNEHSPDGER